MPFSSAYAAALSRILEALLKYLMKMGMDWSYKEVILLLRRTEVAENFLSGCEDIILKR